MSLPATTYFEHLKAYVNNEYVLHDGVGGKVILAEKYFRAEDVKPQSREIELLLPGPGMVFKLDHDSFETSSGKHKPALFHFLDDQAKPWSRRCDFVVFYVKGRSFHADCIEFKSKSLTPTTIAPQLKAGECWVRSLKRTIEHYTGDTRSIRLRKFVFAENENPDPYLDDNRQLNADPSIRYFHFDEVQGQVLSRSAEFVDPKYLRYGFAPRKTRSMLKCAQSKGVENTELLSLHSQSSDGQES